MTTMTPKRWVQLFEPKLRKVFFEEYTEKEEQFPRVFTVESSEKRQETDFHAASLGMWDKHQDTVDYEDYEPGEEVVYKHETYSKGIKVPFEAAEDDLYDVIGPRGEGTNKTEALARGARARAEVAAADILNDGFTVDGYDDEPLFSDDHPLEKGGTCGNKIDDELSDTGLKEARTLMRRQVDGAGLKIQAVGKEVIVPDHLEYTALEVTESTHKHGTNYNDKNVIGPLINNVVVLDYLDHEEDYWFLRDPDFDNLLFFWRIRPEFFSDEDIDRFFMKFTGRMRFSCGHSDWRGLVGSDYTETE